MLEHIANSLSDFNTFCERRLDGIETGIIPLDKALLGLHGITLIQGSTGSNKSTLALQISNYHAKKYGPVLYFDRENGKNRVLMRSFCQRHNLSDVDVLLASQDKKNEMFNAFRLRPFFLFMDKTVEEIEEAIQELKISYGGRRILLVVDSIHALPVDEPEVRTFITKYMNKLDALKLKYEGLLNIIVTAEKKKGDEDSASATGSAESRSPGYRGEIVLDLRIERRTGNIICAIEKDRDGLAGYEIKFQKDLVDPMNPRSFNFLLKPVEDI